jgi:hypothetical protein
VIIDQQRTDRVPGHEEPVDGEPPLDHEHRLIGVHPDSPSWVVEVPIEVQSRVVRVFHFDERARGDNGGISGRVRHPASLA